MLHTFISGVCSVKKVFPLRWISSVIWPPTINHSDVLCVKNPSMWSIYWTNTCRMYMEVLVRNRPTHCLLSKSRYVVFGARCACITIYHPDGLAHLCVQWILTIIHLCSLVDRPDNWISGLLRTIFCCECELVLKHASG